MKWGSEIHFTLLHRQYVSNPALNFMVTRILAQKGEMAQVYYLTPLRLLEMICVGKRWKTKTRLFPFFHHESLFPIIMVQIAPFNERQQPDTLVLFDVDGTLTPARQVRKTKTIRVTELSCQIVIILTHPYPFFTCRKSPLKC